MLTTEYVKSVDTFITNICSKINRKMKKIWRQRRIWRLKAKKPHHQHDDGAVLMLHNRHGNQQFWDLV